MIFVDAIREYPAELIKPEARQAGIKWSHLWDSENDEQQLMRFAKLCGLNPKWMQRQRPDFLHFDVTPRKRRNAILNGAVEKSLIEWVRERQTKLICTAMGVPPEML